MTKTADTMTAAVLAGSCNLEVKEVLMPKAGPGELLIKVSSCGVCGSDIHMWKQGKPWGEGLTDFILGHEFCGTVVVPSDSKFKVGDRVTFWANLYCGTCDMCRQGLEHLCRAVGGKNYIGFVQNGGYAQFFKGPAKNAYLLPDSVSDLAAATIDPLMVAYHAVKSSNPGLNSKVLIAGSGIIGSFIADLCRKKGASYIAMTAPNDTKTRKPRELKLCDDYFLSTDPDLDDKLSKAAPGGFDVCFEAVGNQGAFASLLRSVKPGGTVVMIGNTISPEISFEMNRAVLNEVTLMGSVSCTEKEFTETIDLIATGFIEPERFVTDIVDLHKLQETLKRQGTIDDPLLKAVCLPNGKQD